MIIKNALVYTPDKGFIEKDIAIREGLFEEVSGGSDVSTKKTSWNTPDTFDSEEIFDAWGNYLIPGLIDVHFHGALGCDFSDASLEGLKTIGRYELEHGITAMCPCSMTLPEETLLSICKNAYDYAKESVSHEEKDFATLCGIHLEGPFISEAKKGAQNPDYIANSSREMFLRLQEASHGLVKLISMAPEKEGSMDFIRELSSQVHISLGHTNCDYDCAMEAFKAGADHVTHFYNAMPAFTHRSPGLIGAAFDHDKTMAELICDGIHVHPSAIRTAFRQLGKERIILISDSLSAAGMTDGDYTLGGLPIRVKGAYATLTDGTLAGSVSNLMDCMKKVISMGISLEDAIYCASYTPAKSIGIEDMYGSIEAGKYGDCVLLNKDDLSVMRVFHHSKTF